MEEAKHMSGSDAGVSTTNRFLQNWRKFVTIALIFTRSLKYIGSAGTPFSKIKLFYKQSVNRHPHLLVSVAAASLLCALNFQPSAWTMHVSFFSAWRNGIFKIVQDMKKMNLGHILNFHVES